jgi:hypothetical protein
MSNYTVPPGNVGVHKKTLAPGVIDTVTFALGDPGTPGWNKVPRRVEILTDGVDEVYATTDGSAPTVAGGNTYRLPSAGGLVAVVVSVDSASGAAVVKLISSGSPVYSVSRAG